MEQLTFEYKANPFNGLNPMIVEKFEEYHRRNPLIYEMFKRFSYEAKTRFKNFGAKAIWERLRWETDVCGIGDYKLNNNYVSAYARMLIQDDPTFKDFFRTRDSNHGMD